MSSRCGWSASDNEAGLLSAAFGTGVVDCVDGGPAPEVVGWGPGLPVVSASKRGWWVDGAVVEGTGPVGEMGRDGVGGGADVTGDGGHWGSRG